MTTAVAPAGPAEAAPPGERTRARSDGRFAWSLAAIGVVALAVRAWGVLVYRDPFRVWGDSLFYHLQGRALAEGRGFVDPIRLYLADGVEPTAGHPPLYGLYLALVTVLGGESATAHRLASALLGTATVVVVGLVGRRLAGPRAGLLAAGAAALFPPLFVNDYMLMSETMAAFLVAVALLAAYRQWQHPSVLAATLCGAAVGAAALTRAEIVLLVPVVLVVFCLRAPGATAREGRRYLLVGTAAAAALLLPWVAFNLSRFEEPTFLSTGFGATLSAASCDITYSGEYLGWYLCGYRADDSRTDVVSDERGPIGPPVAGDESERDVVVRRLALDYVGDNLDRLPVVVAARVGRLWNAFRPWQTARFDGVIEGRGLGATRLGVLASWVALPLAVVGLVSLRRRGVPISPFVTLAITVPLAAAATFGVPRYRVPADVGLVLAAGIGVDAIWRRLRPPAATPSAPDGSGAAPPAGSGVGAAR